MSLRYLVLHRCTRLTSCHIALKARTWTSFACLSTSPMTLFPRLLTRSVDQCRRNDTVAFTTSGLSALRVLSVPRLAQKPSADSSRTTSLHVPETGDAEARPHHRQIIVERVTVKLATAGRYLPCQTGQLSSRPDREMMHSLAGLASAFIPSVVLHAPPPNAKSLGSYKRASAPP